MSRAGAKASRDRRRAEAEARALEEEFTFFELDAAADAIVVACEGCGLEQVHPGLVYDPLLDELVRHDGSCTACGCEIGTFVESLQSRYEKTPLSWQSWRA